MSNVLSDEKRQQILALGRLGWPLRRIEQATGVRRETAGAYLRSGRIAVRPAGGWGRRAAKPAKEVTTDSGPSEWLSEVTTTPRQSKRAVSACEPYRDLIELGLQRDRNAMAIWQELVTEYGFERNYQSVKRFVNKLRPAATL